MDDDRFDAFSRALAEGLSRRRMGQIAVSLLGALGLTVSVASEADTKKR